MRTGFLSAIRSAAAVVASLRSCIGSNQPEAETLLAGDTGRREHYNLWSNLADLRARPGATRRRSLSGARIPLATIRRSSGNTTSTGRAPRGFRNLNGWSGLPSGRDPDRGRGLPPPPCLLLADNADPPASRRPRHWSRSARGLRRDNSSALQKIKAAVRARLDPTPPSGPAPC